MTEAIKAAPFEVDPHKDVSYINLTLLDASKTIETTVKEKLSESINKVRFPMVRRVLGKERVQGKLVSVVANKVKPSTVAKELSDQVPKQLMYILHQKMGMKVAARAVFVQDAYVVIEFQVKHVDTQKLLAKVQEGIPEDGGMNDMDMEVPPEVVERWMKEMEREASEGPSEGEPEPEPAPDAVSSAWSWSGWIAAQSEYVITKLIPEGYKTSLEQDAMPPFVQWKITEEMGAILEKRLAQKHLEAEIAVLASKSQARYFYTNLEAARGRNE